ncbi:DUF3127 domain-containing protein [Halpernia frigidisoli]|uniref:DUF3127 domain-containing protein n=1 Tax=Halpernia frigidisoli TaxID=1125876 RepID=A0A1I3HIU8_9FLAO|nr:DUF3127 domain-containing protein [Halpernia frigidisoli]SFI35602.1 protein of unknown function [Halpernia frigidisoli]
MELQGSVKKLGEVQTFASGFTKRELVIVTEEQYPQPINIEFLKDKGDLLNSFNEGDRVKVSINIGGREWTSPQGEVKYFNSITGWRVEKLDGNVASAEPTSAPQNTSSTPSASNATDVFAEDEDDLPF